MIFPLPRLSLVAALAVTALAVSAPAFAQDDDAPATASVAAPSGAPQVLYVAPLYQQTQDSYVPQSIAMSGPHEILDWQEGDRVPSGYHKVERLRRGLVVAGAVLFGCTYFLSSLSAAAGADSASSGQSNQLAALWIPGVGPFIQMTQTQSAVGNYFLAIDGLAQSAGLAMLVAGLTSPKTVLVRNDLGEETKPKVHAAPIVGRNMTGVGLVGSF